MRPPTCYECMVKDVQRAQRNARAPVPPIPGNANLTAAEGIDFVLRCLQGMGADCDTLKIEAQTLTVSAWRLLRGLGAPPACTPRPPFPWPWRTTSPPYRTLTAIRTAERARMDAPLMQPNRTMSRYVATDNAGPSGVPPLPIHLLGWPRGRYRPRGQHRQSTPSVSAPLRVLAFVFAAEMRIPALLYLSAPLDLSTHPTPSPPACTPRPPFPWS